MNNRHPITPPPELVEQWLREWKTLGVRHADPVKSTSYVATEAARWGADQELEACCEWIPEYFQWNRSIQDADRLRAARRPNRPSLKEQALALINSNKPYLDDTAMDTIRRALEALND